MGGTWLLGWITLPVGLVIGYKRWPLWAHLIVPIVVSGIVMNVSVGGNPFFFFVIVVILGSASLIGGRIGDRFSKDRSNE